MKSLALFSLLPALVAAQGGYGYGGGAPPPAASTTSSAPATVPSAPAGDNTHINVYSLFPGRLHPSYSSHNRSMYLRMENSSSSPLTLAPQSVLL